MTACTLVWSYVAMPINPDHRTPVLSVRGCSQQSCMVQAMSWGHHVEPPGMSAESPQCGILQGCTIPPLVTLPRVSAGQASLVSQHSRMCTAFLRLTWSLLPVQTWLQEFAWTEREKPEKLAVRNQTLHGDETLQREPMFCFETALKLFYWTALVYDHKEVGWPRLCNCMRRQPLCCCCNPAMSCISMMACALPQYGRRLPASWSQSSVSTLQGS